MPSSTSERIATVEARLQAVEEALRDLTQELRNDRRHVEERLRRLEEAAIRLASRGSELRWLLAFLLPALASVLVTQIWLALR